MKKSMLPQKIKDRSLLYLRNKAPTILSLVAAAGVVFTSILVGKATVKAVKTLDEEPQKYKDSKIDVAIAVTPYYIPAFLTGLATVSCIFGANALNKRNQAILMSAYAMINQSYHNYREKLIELHGKEADEEVVNELARERCDYHIRGLNVPDQKVIFYDPISERSIDLYEREVMDAEYHFNRSFVLRGYAFLNEFYDFLGMEHTNYGAVAGWTAYDGLMWIDFEHHLLEEDDGGTPIYVIDMPWGPDILSEADL